MSGARCSSALLCLAVLTGGPAPPAAADPCRGLRLTDVAASAGIRFVHDRGARGHRHLPETMGAGAAWIDYDGDGWLDLYVVQSGPFPPDHSPAAANRLYRNRGDGSFVEVGERAGAAQRGYGQGVASGDVNGDGWIDLFVCNFGADALLINQGDGTFRERPAPTGPGEEGWSSSAAFADADGDGDLDLYVTRYVEYDFREDVFCGDPETGERKYCDPTLFHGAADSFYRNRGDGSFEDATAEAGLDSADGRGLGVVFTDLDGDGRPDLYVANDLTINLLYRNLGDGSFESLSLLSGAGLNRQGKAEAGMGVAAGDVDGDGDPDLLVTNFDVETNTLYVNLGQMVFEDRSAESGFGVPSFNLLGFGLILNDLDLDGDLDAYVANGHIYERPARETIGYEQPDLLLLGDGRGGFEARPCGPAFESRLVGRGLASADYDRDGDLDLVVTNNGGPLVLLRNDGLRARWVGVRLSGVPPNREAIGARVTLITEQGRQLRWVGGGDSYQSASDRRLLFGLAAGDRPRAIEVSWPSGRTTSLNVPTTGAYLTIDELSGLLESTEASSRTGTALRLLLALALVIAIGGGVLTFRWARRR